MFTESKMKKYFLISFFIVAFIIAGCEVSVSTAALSDAVICSSVDPQTAKPVEKSDVFSPEASEIFCSVKLSHAPEDTQVTIEWYYVKGEVEELTNHKVSDYSLKTDGTKYVYFSISKPDNGFPKGDYTCNLFLNGKEKIIVPFKVQ